MNQDIRMFSDYLPDILTGIQKPFSLESSPYSPDRKTIFSLFTNLAEICLGNVKSFSTSRL